MMNKSLKQEIQHEIQQAARWHSRRKLREQLNHPKTTVREVAEQELKQRDTIRRIRDARWQVDATLQPVNRSTLTENAIDVEVEVLVYEVSSFEIPYSYKAWWYDGQCIAFSHAILDNKEAEEWLNYIRSYHEDEFNDEPVDAILDGNRIIIFDTPPAPCENNSDDYRVEFARKESPWKNISNNKRAKRREDFHIRNYINGWIMKTPSSVTLRHTNSNGEMG